MCLCRLRWQRRVRGLSSPAHVWSALGLGRASAAQGSGSQPLAAFICRALQAYTAVLLAACRHSHRGGLVHSHASQGPRWQERTWHSRQMSAARKGRASCKQQPQLAQTHTGWNHSLAELFRVTQAAGQPRAALLQPKTGKRLSSPGRAQRAGRECRGVSALAHAAALGAFGNLGRFRRRHRGRGLLRQPAA